MLLHFQATRGGRDAGVGSKRDKIMLVEDAQDILRLLAFLVKRIGADPLAARDAPTALALLDREHPDLAIVGDGHGSSSGFELVAELRSRSDLPIILLGVRDSEDDKVRGLEAGADDYLVKPFGQRELVARIRARLRRRRPEPSHNGDRSILRSGPLTMNVAEHAAEKQGRSLNLTAMEFKLLHYLMDRTSTVVSRETLVKDVWGYADAGAREVLRVTLYRLRHKLEDDPSAPRLLHTVPGVGVMLKPEPGEAGPEPAVS